MGHKYLYATSTISASHRNSANLLTNTFETCCGSSCCLRLVHSIEIPCFSCTLFVVYELNSDEKARNFKYWQPAKIATIALRQVNTLWYKIIFTYKIKRLIYMGYGSSILRLFSSCNVPKFLPTGQQHRLKLVLRGICKIPSRSSPWPIMLGVPPSQMVTFQEPRY